MKKLVVGLVVCWQVASALAAAPALKFDVLEFVVEGNTVLPGELVEQVLQPFMGPDKGFKDIESAREALEKAYQDAGFLSVVVSLPNQRVDSGEVRLDVTEARVDKLRITGAQYTLPSKLREQVPSLAPGQTPYFPQVQQELAAMQSADVQVTPLIGAGAEPETIQVDLKVQDKPSVQGSVELSNRQSFNTSAGRLSAAVSYGNLFQRGHRMGLSWQYAPWRPADANTLSWTYGVPLSAHDDLTASYTNSRSDTPINTGDGGNTLTRGQFYGLRWQHDLTARQWPIRHGLFASLDYKHNEDKTNIVDTLSTEKPPLRYTALSAGYNLMWTGQDDRQLGFSTSAVTSSHALSGRQVNCDGTQTDQFACKRSGSSPDFLAWRTGLDYKSQPLWGRWRLTASSELQLASGPLASGEQYSLGGQDTVRGYYDFEQAGDWGWSARLEALSPTVLDAAGWRAHALLFYDRGFVALIDPLIGQQGHAHLGSRGLGLRLDGALGLQLSLDWALPIYDSRRAADGGGYELATHRNKARWLASVRLAF
jgi:hemolysin activation/secretion protein